MISLLFLLSSREVAPNYRTGMLYGAITSCVISPSMFGLTYVSSEVSLFRASCHMVILLRR